MRERIKIDRRFCGPPDSGNGGYVCGLAAGFIDGAAEVTLRKPPPLEQSLELERIGKKILFRDQNHIVAEVRPAILELAVPNPPTYAEAKEAAKLYPGFKEHVFPTCFVCGPERAEGDGLRIFPNTIPMKNLVAAPWIPDDSLADDNGKVRPEFLWSALDCPGGWAVTVTKPRPIVLGRLAACVDNRIKPGEQCVVIGWEIGADGRKLYSGSAVFSESGKLCGKAKATWIEVSLPT